MKPASFVKNVLGALLALQSGLALATETPPEAGDPTTVVLPDTGLESIGPAPEPVATDDGAGMAPADSGWGVLEILGAQVRPGTRADLHWSAGQSFSGSSIETPVVVLRGHTRGPTLCLTAAVHGDELNGVEIVRRVLAAIDIDDDELAGTLIGVPIVNLLGFSRGSRYLPDRRDLNRYFPGDPHGSSASRIAHVFFTDVIRHCQRLVDLHTGSFKRTNLPQLRANLDIPHVRKFVRRFGATAVLHKAGQPGTLRYAATAAGIPAVAFELGEPGTLQLEQVRFGVKAIDTLLDKLDMVDRLRLWLEPQPIFYHSRWLRAYRGGILTAKLGVGARISEGDILGVVTNPLTNEQSQILSPYTGRLLGRALNQFVLPGFATFHIGIETDEIGDSRVNITQDDTVFIDDPADGGGAARGFEMRPLDSDAVEHFTDDEEH